MHTHTFFFSSSHCESRRRESFHRELKSIHSGSYFPVTDSEVVETVNCFPLRCPQVFASRWCCHRWQARWVLWEGAPQLSRPVAIRFKQTSVFAFGFVHFVLLHNFVCAFCNTVKALYPALAETLFGEEAPRCGKITSGSARVPGESLSTGAGRDLSKIR